MTPDLFSLLHPALAAASTPAIPAARLVPAALLGIAVIVLLITRFKLHPFLGLTIGSLVVGAVAGVSCRPIVDSFTKGFGATAASVGTLIALGAMFGKLLADSGGADEIVDTIVGRSSARTLPWAMAGVGAHHRPADVLRDRPRAPDAGHLPRGPPLRPVGHQGRHPRPRRSVGHARARPAAPRSARGHRRPQGQPRPHPRPRCPRRHPDRRHRRPALRPVRRPLGRRPRPDDVRDP